MKNSWQGYAVAVLTSLILGGTATYLTSSARIDKLEARIDKIGDESINTQLLIIKALTRLETQVEYIVKELDKP